jgi:hypothetical protein
VAKPAAEVGGGFAVAWEAEDADVVEVALAAALGYGDDVVGVPEGAADGDGFDAPEGESFGTGFAAAAFEVGVGGDGVGGAGGADATVAGEDEIAEVAGVGAETPLVDAVIGAEGAAAASEDFKLAPATEGETVGAEREGCAADASGFGEGSGGARWHLQQDKPRAWL